MTDIVIRCIIAAELDLCREIWVASELQDLQLVVPCINCDKQVKIIYSQSNYQSLQLSTGTTNIFVIKDIERTYACMSKLFS